MVASETFIIIIVVALVIVVIIVGSVVEHVDRVVQEVIAGVGPRSAIHAQAAFEDDVVIAPRSGRFTDTNGVIPGPELDGG